MMKMIEWKNLGLRVLKVWLMAAATLVAVHRWRDGDWQALPSDLGWAALAAAIVVASQRWHAARGIGCAMCAEVPIQQEEKDPVRSSHGTGHPSPVD